jgi:pyrroloquinoline quinone (PQQ) biosynthesis protein C
MLFQKAVEATAADRRMHIENNPAFKCLYGGEFTRWHYLAYLRETYHLIRHTPRYLALTAGRLEDGDRWLRDWLLHFADEEKGHDLLCLHDIRVQGENPDAVVAEPPLGGAWAMVAQNYYLASYGNPVAILGFAVATEGLGASTATRVADYLEAHYGIPHEATSFLRVHGEADVEHFEEAKVAVERYAANPAHFRDIVHVWRMTLRSYGQLFRDVLADVPPGNRP